MRDKGGGPLRASPNKHLNPSNSFQDYGWFFTRDDKHVLLKISTYLWMKNKVKCSKAWSKEEIFQKIIIHAYTQDHVKYKYVERSFRLNYDEELEVHASVLRATEFEEYALVHPNV